MTSEPTTRRSPGDRAPELSLTNADGVQVRFSDLLGRPVIVHFLPKAFTPGCTTEVCDFRDNKASVQRESAASADGAWMGVAGLC